MITCVSGIINPFQEWTKYLQLAEVPEIRFVVSNTNESGIRFNSEDKLNEPEYSEFPGKLVTWLYHRYQFFKGDFSKTCVFLPIELVERNGDLLRHCMLQYANLWELGDEFKTWISAQTYCNSLVDRIVSGYPKDEAEQLNLELGIEDKLLVAGEYYHSWIIQAPKHVKDEMPFSQTKLNVRFVDNLDIYREIKIKILNGAHTAMVPVGYLAGTRTVYETMQIDEVREFLKAMIFQEVIHTIDFPKEELEDFSNDVFNRFSNPCLKHQLLDIALNSTSKFVTRLLPGLLEYHRKYGKLPRRMVFSLAALIRFYKGDWQGQQIPLRDAEDRLRFFRDAWSLHQHASEKLVEQVLQNVHIWGMDLTTVTGLRAEICFHLEKMKYTLKLSELETL